MWQATWSPPGTSLEEVPHAQVRFGRATVDVGRPRHPVSQRGLAAAKQDPPVIRDSRPPCRPRRSAIGPAGLRFLSGTRSPGQYGNASLVPFSEKSSQLILPQGIRKTFWRDASTRGKVDRAFCTRGRVKMHGDSRPFGESFGSSTKRGMNKRGPTITLARSVPGPDQATDEAGRFLPPLSSGFRSASSFRGRRPRVRTANGLSVSGPWRLSLR